jgi:hypothetical protein
LTCAKFTDSTSGGYYASTVYSAADLTAMTQTEFESCLVYFGKEANYWPDSYISAFYQQIKTLYPTTSSIPSTVITDMGIIAYKFSTSELSQLNLASDDAVSSLGKLNAFSVDQVIKLMSFFELFQLVDMPVQVQIAGLSHEVKWSNSNKRCDSEDFR